MKSLIDDKYEGYYINILILFFRYFHTFKNHKRYTNIAFKFLQDTNLIF